MKHIVRFLSLLIVATLAFAVPAIAKDRIVFGGGPAGGTFQVVANAIQVYGPVKAMDFSVKAQSSAGSVENLRKVDSGRMDFGVVYSGHVYLGANGMMKKRYQEVRERSCSLLPLRSTSTTGCPCRFRHQVDQRSDR